MRILRLSLGNIGPYVAPVAIDFTGLGTDGLFLIEGSTGAGKTTLIDAIVFAIYGKMASSASDAKRMDSLLRSPDDTPWVELVIETRKGVFRVRRTPGHSRAGSAKNATVQLWKLDGPDDEGVLVSNRIQEANTELEEAIGLTREQFTQTVVLPQGDFATFLLAAPEQRKDILTRVFGTQIFDEILSRLGQSAKDWRRSVDEASSRWAADAAAFRAVAWPAQSGGLDARDQFDSIPAGDEGDHAAAITVAEQRCVELAGLREAAMHQAVEADDRLAEAQGLLQRAEESNRHLAERDRLRQELAGLAADVGTMAVERSVLEFADRAEQLRRPLAAADDARKAAREAAAWLSQAQLAAGGLVAEPDPRRPDVAVDGATAGLSAEAAERRRELERELDLVAQLQERVRKLDDLTVSVSCDEALLADGRVAVADAEQAQAQAEERLAALAGEQSDSEQAAAALLAAQTAKDNAQRVWALARQAAELLDQERALLANQERQAERLNELAAAHEHAHDAWVAGLAANVAAELADGAPCPVCGSVEHPAPARPTGGYVSRGDVEQLRGEEASARDDLHEVLEELAALRARRDGLVDQVGEIDPSEAAKEMVEAAAEVSRCEAAAKQVEKVADAIRRENAELDRLRVEVASRIVEVARRDGELGARREALRAEREAVQAEQTSVPLNQRAAIAREGLAALDAVVGAVQAWETASLLARERVSELERLLAEHGFASPEAVRSALLPTDELERRRAAVATYDSRKSVIEARLSAPELAGALEPVDEVPLRLEWLDRRSIANELHERLGVAKNAVDEAGLALAGLRSAAEGLAAALAGSAPWLRMNAVASGDNQLSMTLPTFVLLRRFDEVLELANRRLLDMTAGRYELERTEDAEGRTKRQGLGLQMVDHEADDAPRATRTLSGGETFLTSLALALGLSDAVTAEAGGIELGTLLVDEGFGTLDAEYLDRVMTQFASLGEGGRQVGVISHVEELKGRITDRLTVRSHGDGTSTVECSIPGVVELLS